jgi:hypothetical protein
MGSTDMILCVDSLQELIAPRTVRFYSMDWRYLGSKLELQEIIQQITGIEAEALTAGTLETFSIARRMSWAAKRETTRIEDQAYSLMGIFDVNMPLLYGEGQKAFIRLQEAILKVSDDQSLFAWGLPAEVKTMQQFFEEFWPTPSTTLRGLFAKSPSEFTNSELIHVLEDEQSALPPIVSSNGVRIELQVKQYPKTNVQFAIIYCTLHGRYNHYIGFPIMPWGKRWVARFGELVTVPVQDLVAANSARPFSKPSVLFIKSPATIPRELNVRNTVKLIELSNQHKDHYTFDDVHCAEHASYSPKDQTLTVSGNQDTLHAVYFYVPAVSDLISLFSFEKSRRHELLKSDMSFTMRNLRPTNTHIFTIGGWSMAHMPFAILVGGRLEDPWLRIMIITSEDASWTDLGILLESDKDFKSCCTTKSSLLSLLNRSNKVGLPKSNVTPHARQITMRSTFKDVFGAYKPVSAQLGVSAQLRVVASSLVETSLTILVAIENFGDSKFEKQVQWPGWWAKLVDTAQEE